MGGERYSERKVGRAVPVTALRGVTGEPPHRHRAASAVHSTAVFPSPHADTCRYPSISRTRTRWHCIASIA